jgi:unsaturated rhamnogalacturonyl hydrolase
MWLDGIYMGDVFYARYEAAYGSDAATNECFDDILHQFELMYEHTRDSATGLLYHAWDESREQKWANPTTGCSPHFWGRAMGWYCMALLDTLDYIPKSRADIRGRLLEIAKSLIDPLTNVQDKQSGLWYQVLDKGAYKKNYLESSASSMFVYFLLKLNKIYEENLSKNQAETAEKTANAGYKGLLTTMLTEDQTNGELHLNGICSVAGLGGNPYRSGDFTYYVSEPVVADDFKGVGPFILASLEYEQILNYHEPHEPH